MSNSGRESTSIMIPVNRKTSMTRRNVSFNFPNNLTLDEFRNVTDAFCIIFYGQRIGTEIHAGNTSSRIGCDEP